MLKKIIFRALISLGFTMAYAAASSEAAFTGVGGALLRSNAPLDYEVSNNDTVLGLAHRYLKKSAYWPEFLGVTSLGATKLYPGDKLHILSINGQKLLVVNSGRSGSFTRFEKLVPTVRAEDLEALPAISIRKLRNLILRPTIMPENEFESAPIVVAGGDPDQISYTAGDTIYVKGLKAAQVGDQVAVYSKFRSITDPDSKESLGYEVRYDGDALVSQLGPISSLELMNSSNPVSALDRIIPEQSQLIPFIVPHKADQVITGKIVALYDSLTSTAQDNTVVINRGRRDGVDIGQIFDITNTRQIDDPTSADPDLPKKLILPPQDTGEILIYKVYDKLAFGLITDSTRAVPLNAVVQSQE